MYECMYINVYMRQRLFLEQALLLHLGGGGLGQGLEPQVVARVRVPVRVALRQADRPPQRLLGGRFGPFLGGDGQKARAVTAGPLLPLHRQLHLQRSKHAVCMNVCMYVCMYE